MKQIITHDCSDELRESDLKVTPARLAILKLLERIETPIDVASIIAYLDKNAVKTDPATVFRIMNVFTKQGLAKQIRLQEGKTRYELAANADHHHLVCTNCGDIQDISNCNISELKRDIEKKTKFSVTSHSLEFFGRCSNCQK